jgi:glycosyltransferase involved in cell wall biosynthesis
MPDVQFEVIGVPAERHAPIQQTYQPPPNVTLHTPVPRESLPAMYGRASVYAQLSRAEGQPNVLSEAMCCGCIPVGSNVFGIPETIGDTGVVVDVPEIDAITAALRRALDGATPEAREAARTRITDHFSLERRQRHLLDTLARL